MNAMSIRPSSYSRNQRGVALLVVLMLLLVMTLLGLASLRGTLLEERMSASVFDRGLMFQAAESALRQGEAKAAASKKSDYSAACTGGLCGIPNPTNQDQYVDRWLTASPPYVDGTAVTSGDLSVTPKYFVEYMGDAPNWPGCDRERPIQVGCMGPRYRITARATASDRAEVLLQTSYTSPE
ncbi:MAG: pilus assembly PilX family protein [Lysobacter sp.]